MSAASSARAARAAQQANPKPAESAPTTESNESAAHAESAQQSTPERLHHLDALRGGALLLGIVLHTVLGFIPGMPWLFEDAQKVAWSAPVIAVIHLFRMVLFMMLAGYFGRMVLRRRGPGSYLRDRLLRIGLPLVGFWPVAVMSLPIVIVIGSQLRGTELPVDPRTAGETPGPLQMFSPGQLWFLLILLEIVLVVVAVRAILVRLLGADRAGTVSRRIGALLASPVGVVLAAIPYAAGLFAQDSSTGGILEPTTILPVAGASLAYSGAFLVGWFLHAAPGSLGRVAAAWPLKLVLAVALTAASLLVPSSAMVPSVISTALAGWMWVYALVGVAGRFLNREIPAVRYVADASYWIYLLHLPVVVAFGMLFGDLPLPALPKMILNIVLTTGILLIAYDLFVRSTWIGRWLNGRRRPRELFRSRTSARAS